MALSRDFCQLSASYQSSFLPSYTLVMSSSKRIHGFNFTFFKLAASNRVSSVSSSVILTLSANVGFWKFQRNNVLDHHRLELPIPLRYLLQDNVIKNLWAKNTIPASIGSSWSCVCTMMCACAHFVKIIEVISIIPGVLFVLHYDFVYVAWSCPCNVTTILVSVAALFT